MRSTLTSLAAALFFGLASDARAGLTFDFQDHPGHLGTSQSFSSKVSPGVYNLAYQITANGLSSSGTTDLYVKSSPGDESGLGINSDNDHEIAGTNSVDINVSTLRAKYNFTSLSFLLGSVQANEGYIITGGSLNGPVVGSGIGVDGTVTITGAALAYNDFFVKANGGNVLVESVSAAVPEPASLAMMVMGIGAVLGGYRIRRRKAATA